MDGRRDLGIASYEMSWRTDMPFEVLVKTGHRKWPNLAKFLQKHKFFKTRVFPGCFFVMDDRRNMGICSYERSWREDGRRWPNFATLLAQGLMAQSLLEWRMEI